MFIGLSATPLILFCLITTGNASGTDDLLDSLSKRQSRTNAFYYKTEGTRFTPKQRPFPNKPAIEEHTSNLSECFKIDFKNNWAIHETNLERFNLSRQVYLPHHFQLYYDGVTLKQFGPFTSAERKALGYSEVMANVAFKTLDPKDKVQWTEIWDLPLFYYHGFMFSPARPPAIQDIAKGSGDFAYESISKAELEKIQCNVVRIQRDGGKMSGEYWFDPARGYSLMRVDIFGPDAKLRHRIDIKPEKAEWGWIPRSWEYTSFKAKTGVLEVSVKVEVTAFAINEVFDKTQFQGPDLIEDDIVKNRNTKDYYKLDADKNLVRFVPNRARTQNGRGMGFWLVAGGGVMMTIMVIIAIVWKNNKSAKPRA